MERKIDIVVTEGVRAAKEHKCNYCVNGVIAKGATYTKITSRLATERFPITIRLCSTHNPGLAPLGLLLNRP